MKKIYDAVERFCARHPRFGIPNLMRYIVIGNVVVYFLSMLSSKADATALDFLVFNLNGLLHGEVWRLVTFVFVPEYFSPFALIISLYFYYWIGSILEREWGTAKFTLYYAGGALLTLLGVVITSLITGNHFLTLAGTGYVNLSMFLAFAVLFPNMTVLLFFIIPIKIKWLAIVDGVFFAVEIARSILAGNVVGIIGYYTSGSTIYGAYYVTMSMFLAFAALYPDAQVLLFFIIPIKIKWLAFLDAALFAVDILAALLRLDIISALIPIIALLNFLVFFWNDLAEAFGSRRQTARHRNSHQTIQFKSAVKQQQKKESQQGYRHKCCVCGRTDADYPDLEFRYCSRCAGYHCFCQDHIFNHVHFTE